MPYMGGVCPRGRINTVIPPDDGPSSPSSS